MSKIVTKTINKIGVLIFPGVEELDFVGPWEILTMWRDYADGPSTIITVAKHIDTLSCAKGLKVIPDQDFANSPEFDVLFIPGGFSALEHARDKDIIQFVKAQAENAVFMLSVCSGAFILAAADLLVNRRATTHWKAISQLRNQPGVTVEEARFVADGPIWTSAGVSAGTDMALAFVAYVAGEKAASIVQLNAEYYPHDHIYGYEHQRPEAPAYIRKRC